MSPALRPGCDPTSPDYRCPHRADSERDRDRRLDEDRLGRLRPSLDRRTTGYADGYLPGACRRHDREDGYGRRCTQRQGDPGSLNCERRSPACAPTSLVEDACRRQPGHRSAAIVVRRAPADPMPVARGPWGRGAWLDAPPGTRRRRSDTDGNWCTRGGGGCAEAEPRCGPVGSTPPRAVHLWPFFLSCFQCHAS